MLSSSSMSDFHQKLVMKNRLSNLPSRLIDPKLKEIAETSEEREIQQCTFKPDLRSTVDANSKVQSKVVLAKQGHLRERSYSSQARKNGGSSQRSQVRFER